MPTANENQRIVALYLATARATLSELLYVLHGYLLVGWPHERKSKNMTAPSPPVVFRLFGARPSYFLLMVRQIFVSHGLRGESYMQLKEALI